MFAKSFEGASVVTLLDITDVSAEGLVDMVFNCGRIPRGS